MSRRNKQKKSDNSADEKRQPDKLSFVEKIGKRAKVVGSLSETLVKEPKAFPRKTAHAVRPWFRKVWKARGGGLYACGFVVTFVYLEATTIIGEILASKGIVEFFTEQLVELIFRFIGDSLLNMIQAFLWPLAVAEFSPPWGIAILIAMYLLFRYWIGEPLEQWLFHDGD
ncbi:MAG: hypothetical protein IH930_00005 [Proteobacteria bacterium]|nr:hypothetical protein [Pseudomonadota bacterium]